MEKEPEKLVFAPRNEKHDLDQLTKLDEEVEPPTLVVRRSKRVKKPIERYSPLDFRYAFELSAIDNEPKSVREAVNSIEGKLWKDAMVEEMEFLHKNETWDWSSYLMEGNSLVASDCSRRS
jgi:hypothetical protein